MEIAGFVLSILALLFSAFIYIKHDIKIKQQSKLINEYQLERIEKEKEAQKKALIEAFVVKGQKEIEQLKSTIKGQSMAKNVNVIIPENDGYHIFTNPCPIDIKPHNSIEIKLGALLEGHPDKIDIKFEWSDNYKMNNIENQTIQI